MNLQDVELIIVDDGSREKIDDLKLIYPIKLIKLPHHDTWQNPCIVYNTGFNAATGELIMLNSSEVMHMGDITGYVQRNLKKGFYMSFAARMENVDGSEWWGVHSSMGNFIPYCAALTREDIESLSGYDERFKGSMGFDDYDFTRRVHNLGLKMICVDDPYCKHQYHMPTQYTNTINKDLLDYLDNHYPDRIKADENKIYVR
jgi:glycosyltransferase involved in cell wall biosynthesis